MTELIECIMGAVFLVSGVLLFSLVWLALEAVLMALLNPFINMYKRFKGTANDVNT